MNQDRLVGTAKNLGGKVEEGIGKATGDASTEASGKMKQVEGDLQDLYGQARQTAGQAARVVRDQASSFEEMVRDTIEKRPYTAGAALAVGWLIGRMGRPYSAPVTAGTCRCSVIRKHARLLGMDHIAVTGSSCRTSP